jgi:hypothetical protein
MLQYRGTIDERKSPSLTQIRIRSTRSTFSFPSAILNICNMSSLCLLFFGLPCSTQLAFLQSFALLGHRPSALLSSAHFLDIAYLLLSRVIYTKQRRQILCGFSCTGTGCTASRRCVSLGNERPGWFGLALQMQSSLPWCSPRCLDAVLAALMQSSLPWCSPRCLDALCCWSKCLVTITPMFSPTSFQYILKGAIAKKYKLVPFLNSQKCRLYDFKYCFIISIAALSW